jgi:tetratricopeptide (TPR) repeat protein
MTRFSRFALVAMLVAMAGLRPAASGARLDSLDAELSGAFIALYNLDRDEALARARQAVAMAPGESRTHRALATMLWLDALFLRGAVTVDTYLGGFSGPQITLPKPPPALDVEFRKELDQAITLAEARMRRLPRDPIAMHELGSALGLQASYMASVEGRILAAFGAARRAFDLEESVLAHDPSRLDAGLVVGTYRYAVSNLGVPSRMVAYMAGFGGGKAKGLALLEGATHADQTATEARTALVLIYSREGRHQDAFRVLSDLAAAYPRNRLFVLERGAAAIRAGRAEEAEAILTSGLATFEADPRLKIPGERALWFYKRGSARISLNHPAAARQDLDEALRSSPVEWVRGRLQLEAGKADDLLGRRKEAVALYRTAREIAQRTNDAAGASEAARWLDQPFRMPRG